MKKLDKIAHQLLCDLEGVSTLECVKLKDVKLDLIKDALTKYREKDSISAEDRQWFEEKFQLFWLKYGKRIGRTPALKKWVNLKKEEVETVLATVDEFVRVHDEVRFRPHPVTYINQRRWEDELPSQRIPIKKREKHNTWQLI